MGKQVLIIGCLLFSISLFGQPEGYYSQAEGKTGVALRQSLHDIIDDHTVLSYSNLWTAFQDTDRKSDGTVWDMYSDQPGGTPSYTYTFGSDQCGNYSGEGSCYNREHSFPKSWFNDASPMYTDLFHLYPTDGYVNGRRSNYPFGETEQPSWISTNGSKVGPSSTTGYTGTVFEPIDTYKGDFARTYFYMSVRYYGEDSNWAGSPMVDGSQLKAWAREMLIQWHNDDPVSEKERARNDAVFGYQGNRNPFIDRPEFVNAIYSGEQVDELPPVVDSVQVIQSNLLKVWFNEALDSVSASILSHYSVSGSVNVVEAYYPDGEFYVELQVSGLEAGEYVLTINGIEDKSGNQVQLAFYGFSYVIPSTDHPLRVETGNVYPNPNNGNFRVKLNQSAETVQQVKLFGQAGAASAIFWVPSGEYLNCSMDVPAGFYVLEIVSESGSTVQVPVVTFE